VESRERVLVKRLDGHGGDLLVAVGLEQCIGIGSVGKKTPDEYAAIVTAAEIAARFPQPYDDGATLK
jgi:hypothetical protein